MKNQNNIIKVLHLGFSDSIKSGSSLSMMRIHNYLRNRNINSKVLVIKKSSNDKNIIEFNFYNKVLNYIKRLMMFLFKKILNL